MWIPTHHGQVHQVPNKRWLETAGGLRGPLSWGGEAEQHLQLCPRGLCWSSTLDRTFVLGSKQGPTEAMAEPQSPHL